MVKALDPNHLIGLSFPQDQLYVSFNKPHRHLVLEVFQTVKRETNLFFDSLLPPEMVLPPSTLYSSSYVLPLPEPPLTSTFPNPYTSTAPLLPLDALTFFTFFDRAPSTPTNGLLPKTLLKPWGLQFHRPTPPPYPPSSTIDSENWRSNLRTPNDTHWSGGLYIDDLGQHQFFVPIATLHPTTYTPHRRDYFINCTPDYDNYGAVYEIAYGDRPYLGQCASSFMEFIAQLGDNNRWEWENSLIWQWRDDWGEWGEDEVHDGKSVDLERFCTVYAKVVESLGCMECRCCLLRDTPVWR
ncbi:hypothetical protein HDV00_004654 [Rhizophlyctis rosea]|nr:hypothetical protein HDV00_004654 [Rhizophlyctis rosea]